jgi:hypothetical protein
MPSRSLHNDHPELGARCDVTDLRQSLCSGQYGIDGDTPGHGADTRPTREFRGSDDRVDHGAVDPERSAGRGRCLGRGDVDHQIGDLLGGRGASDDRGRPCPLTNAAAASSMDWRAPSRGILQHRLDALGQRRAGQDRVYRDARAGGPLGDAARDGEIGSGSCATADTWCSSWPRWQCRGSCSPRSCVASTACGYVRRRSRHEEPER